MEFHVKATLFFQRTLLGRVSIKKGKIIDGKHEGAAISAFLRLIKSQFPSVKEIKITSVLKAACYGPPDNQPDSCSSGSSSSESSDSSSSTSSDHFSDVRSESSASTDLSETSSSESSRGISTSSVSLFVEVGDGGVIEVGDDGAMERIDITPP